MTPTETRVGRKVVQGTVLYADRVLAAMQRQVVRLTDAVKVAKEDSSGYLKVI